MADILEKKKEGKVVSFKFTACLGRDENGKRICKCTTWKPPAGMTYAKARKQAEVEAYQWEQRLRNLESEPPQGQFLNPLPDKSMPVQKEDCVPEEETFRYFAERVWMELKVVGGGLRPSTISMYSFMLRVMLPKLGDKRITEITGVDIMRYLQYLRDEYRAPNGIRLSEKSVKHHFNTLRNILLYAERQEVIQKNPIRKVDPPRLHKRPVDALTQEEVQAIIHSISSEFTLSCGKLHILV